VWAVPAIDHTALEDEMEIVDENVADGRNTHVSGSPGVMLTVTAKIGENRTIFMSVTFRLQLYY
jgi:hypothetical protein